MANKTSYSAVKAEVLHRIRTNIWPPGTALPSEMALAEEFGCARATINRAMRELGSEGILDRKRKAGTKVKQAPNAPAQFRIPLIREEITATGASYRYRLVSRACTPAPGWLAALLDVTEGQRMVHLTCMHYASRQPFQFEDRWIALDTVPEAEHVDFERHSPNEWLLREVPFTDGQLSFSARRAETALAEYLDAEPGAALFTAERTTWIETRPVTHVRLSFAPGYRMTTQL